jgi:hypothetical protein
MKAFALLAIILTLTFPARADSPTWQELNTHLFTNAVIVWQAATNHLPKSLWVYQRQLPNIFSTSIISNAVVLASLQSKGFPKPSTNNYFVWEDKGPNYPGSIASIFGIIPGDANIYYAMPNSNSGSNIDIPNDATIIRLAWQYAANLGLDGKQLVQKPIYTDRLDSDQNGNETPSRICGRGVFLSRQLDGVPFFSDTDNGSGEEGFSIEFGSHEKIRSFNLRWSELKRYKNQPTANVQQIIRYIREHKIIVLPDHLNENYFDQLRSLAKIKKLTITKITSYYGTGTLGEAPTNDAPSAFVKPFAEMEAVADFGTSNAPVRFITPIITSDEVRLFGN